MTGKVITVINNRIKQTILTNYREIRKQDLIIVEKVDFPIHFVGTVFLDDTVTRVPSMLVKKFVEVIFSRNTST